MSKNNNSNVPTTSWGSGFVVNSDFFDRLIGKVLTTVEVMGLNEKQEESAKSIIRQGVWDLVTESSIFISEERNTEIRNEYYQKRKEANNGNVPMSAI